MKVVIDTNVLIDNPQVLLDNNISPLIPYTVLSELDNLKRNPDLKRAAQTAIKLIHDGMLNNHVEVTNIPTSITTPDERIVKAAKTKDAFFMSGDIGAQAIAIARNVKLIDTLKDETIDYNYTGYCTIKGTVEYEQKFVQIKELPLEEFNEIFNTNLKENEYCIIDRIIEKNDIWVNKKGKVTRISQSMKPFRDAGIVESPLDSEQMCALNAVFDPDVPLTIISGALGTGKTILSLISALACVKGQKRYKYYDKVYVTRPPSSINKDMKLGFLPGTLEEKLGDWMGGIKSNLKFLLEKTERDKKEEVAEEVFNDYFEMINIDSIQGVSLHDTILLVDEFQLLDTDTLKLVLSRISSGSKVVLIGDTDGQTYGINRANEGFKVLYKHLGNSEEMNYIKLVNIYRSKLAEFVQKIFED